MSQNWFSCRNKLSRLVSRNQLSCQDSYPALCREINFRANTPTLLCAAKSTFVPILLSCFVPRNQLLYQDSYSACAAKSTFVPILLPFFVPRNQLSCQYSYLALCREINFRAKTSSQSTPTPTMSFP